MRIAFASHVMRRSAGSFCAMLAIAVVAAAAPSTHRAGKNEVVSTEFPCARIEIRPPLKYFGRHPFEIHGVAAGERLLFVETRGRQVRSLWIAQFEAILPTSRETYRYGFQNAVTLGGLAFKPSTFAFSSRAAAVESPEGEASLTAKLLRDRGVEAADELMCARFAAVPDPAKRHEMILFYCEPTADNGHALRDFYKGDTETAVWKEIAVDLNRRGLESFRVAPVCGR